MGASGVAAPGPDDRGGGVTDDLVGWLTARIDEDEALARRNTDGHGLGDGFPDYRTYDGPDLAAADEYIDRFGPLRVLAECDTKRRLIEELRHSAEYVGEWCGRCSFNDEPSLKLLALPYADRPGYRGEWKP